MRPNLPPPYPNMNQQRPLYPPPKFTESYYNRTPSMYRSEIQSPSYAPNRSRQQTNYQQYPHPQMMGQMHRFERQNSLPHQFGNNGVNGMNGGGIRYAPIQSSQLPPTTVANLRGRTNRIHDSNKNSNPMIQLQDRQSQMARQQQFHMGSENGNINRGYQQQNSYNPYQVSDNQQNSPTNGPFNQPYNEGTIMGIPRNRQYQPQQQIQRPTVRHAMELVNNSNDPFIQQYPQAYQQRQGYPIQNPDSQSHFSNKSNQDYSQQQNIHQQNRPLSREDNFRQQSQNNSPLRSQQPQERIEHQSRGESNYQQRQNEQISFGRQNFQNHLAGIGERNQETQRNQRQSEQKGVSHNEMILESDSHANNAEQLNSSDQERQKNQHHHKDYQDDHEEHQDAVELDMDGIDNLERSVDNNISLRRLQTVESQSNTREPHIQVNQKDEINEKQKFHPEEVESRIEVRKIANNNGESSPWNAEKPRQKNQDVTLERAFRVTKALSKEQADEHMQELARELGIARQERNSQLSSQSLKIRKKLHLDGMISYKDLSQVLMNGFQK